MVWKTNPPSKRGRWVGPGVCIGTHRGSVWVNMRGSLWKCSQFQCKLATTEESRHLEIQNQLLDDMKAEFQEFPGRRVYTDVEREGSPPSQSTGGASSLREALQGENVQVPSDVSSHLDSDRSHRTASQNFRNQSWSMPPDVLSREMEENVQNVRTLDSDHPVNIRMSRSNFLTIPLLRDSRAIKQENEHLNVWMSHQHGVLGWRIQRVPSVGQEWMIQDNEFLPQL